MIFLISCCSSCQKDKKVTLAYSLTLTASSDSYQAPEALQRVQTAEKIEDIEVEVEVGRFFLDACSSTGYTVYQEIVYHRVLSI